MHKIEIIIVTMSKNRYQGRLSSYACYASRAFSYLFFKEPPSIELSLYTENREKHKTRNMGTMKVS